MARYMSYVTNNRKSGVTRRGLNARKAGAPGKKKPARRYNDSDRLEWYATPSERRRGSMDAGTAAVRKIGENNRARWLLLGATRNAPSTYQALGHNGDPRTKSLVRSSDHLNLKRAKKSEVVRDTAAWLSNHPPVGPSAHMTITDKRGYHIGTWVNEGGQWKTQQDPRPASQRGKPMIKPKRNPKREARSSLVEGSDVTLPSHAIYAVWSKATATRGATWSLYGPNVARKIMGHAKLPLGVLKPELLIVMPMAYSSSWEKRAEMSCRIVLWSRDKGTRSCADIRKQATRIVGRPTRGTPSGVSVLFLALREGLCGKAPTKKPPKRNATAKGAKTVAKKRNIKITYDNFTLASFKRGLGRAGSRAEGLKAHEVKSVKSLGPGHTGTKTRIVLVTYKSVPLDRTRYATFVWVPGRVVAGDRQSHSTSNWIGPGWDDAAGATAHAERHFIDRKKNMAKKTNKKRNAKRSPAQLAATRRLVAMNKAKRGSKKRRRNVPVIGVGTKLTKAGMAKLKAAQKASAAAQNAANVLKRKALAAEEKASRAETKFEAGMVAAAKTKTKKPAKRKAAKKAGKKKRAAPTPCPKKYTYLSKTKTTTSVRKCRTGGKSLPKGAAVCRGKSTKASQKDAGQAFRAGQGGRPLAYVRWCRNFNNLSLKDSELDI